MCSVIRKARLSKGYSQHYLSVQLEVSPKTYQRMEKNESKNHTFLEGGFGLPP